MVAATDCGSWDKLKLKISRVRWRIEKRLCPDPFIVHGRFRNAELGKINWLKEVNAVPVEFMNGFRMSFRTRLITKHGFDEALGRYALFEDIDASFSIMKTHHVVAALGAEIFHYKSSKKRDCGTVLARISHKAEAA
jgi:GT2 family glycosyltransferase